MAPVFVDELGRRRRALGIAGMALAAVLVITLGAIGMAFAGGGSAALPGLPDAPKGYHPATGHLPPVAAPSAEPTPGVSADATKPSASASKATAPTPTTSPTPATTTTHPNNGHTPTTRPSHGPKN